MVLGFNEISTPGGVALVEALQNKSNLKSVILDGNQFGDVGKKLISKLMQERGQDDVLGSLSDDEGEPDDDETDSDNEEGMCNDFKYMLLIESMHNCNVITSQNLKQVKMNIQRLQLLRQLQHQLRQ